MSVGRVVLRNKSVRHTLQAEVVVQPEVGLRAIPHRDGEVDRALPIVVGDQINDHQITLGDDVGFPVPIDVIHHTCAVGNIHNAIGEDGFLVDVDAEVFLREQWQFFAAARFKFHLAVVALGELDKVLHIPTPLHAEVAVVQDVARSLNVLVPIK